MKIKSTLAFVCLLSFAVSTFSLTPEISGNAEPKAIRTTPPAPKFSDAERQAELAKRRAKVFEAMKDKSVMILFSTEPRIYTNDVDFLYRQENNLYYLTNLKQNNATLVLTKDGAKTQEFLFLPKRSPQAETWMGKMYSREDATRLSGVKTIVDTSELNDFIQAVKNKTTFAAKDNLVSNPLIAETVYLLMPKGARDNDGMREFRKEYEFATSLSNYKVENAQPIFAALRHIKSPMEQRLLQHAIDITTEAQMRAMATVKQAKWEYETQAEIEYVFRKRNADYWGYPSIIGCGPNATTLHYEESQGEVKNGDLLLMDVGAEYDHYTADVTRTFPVNGKFSKEQAEIYQIVYDAQEAAAKKIKPGASFQDAARAADEIIKQGLTKLGLITAPNATYQIVFQGKPIEMPQYRLWYMHGWGHWLGMNVHDVGDYAKPLQAGMVTTNEPGIYVREDALEYIPDTPANKEFLTKIRPLFEKYKNIGVRIEDDMLVTPTGVEWMTKALPRTIADVEAFMAKASKEVPNAGFEKHSNPSTAFLENENLLFGNDFNWSLFDANQIVKGKTVRRGWVFDGKKMMVSGLSHVEHSHGE